MPFLVLAVGASMSLIGAYFAWTGSSLIQFERGWSAVIAGATLVTGGLVVMALGLVLRMLGDVRKAIVGTPIAATVPAFVAAPAAPVPSPPETDMPAHRRTQAEPHVEATHAEPTHVPPRPIAGPHAAPMLAESLRPEPVPVPPPPAEPLYEDQPSDAERETYTDPHAEHPADDADPVATHAREPDPSASPESHVPQAEPVEGAAPRVEPPAPAAVQAGTPAPHDAPDTSPAMDDWLDRSFADIEREMAVPRERPPVRLPRTAPPAPRLTEPAHAGTALMEPETVAEAVDAAHAPQDPAHGDAPPEVAPAAAEPPSAVIGRYESEGTSYVMYADGSIEAQSDAGVYRFASMAELKAFIEG